MKRISFNLATKSDNNTPHHSVAKRLTNSIKSSVFYSTYNKMFETVIADTDELREEAHRLRYKVFCTENEGYEDPKAHPNGMEMDRFDDTAEHALLMYKPLNIAIGTVRVIGPNENNLQDSFPLQNLCGAYALHDETLVKNSCEFSRLCISKEARGAVKEHLAEQKSLTIGRRDNCFSIHEKPLLNIALSAAPLGLVKGAFEIMMQNQFLNGFGIMEEVHLGKLVNAGLVYEQIGPVMDYHGKRLPFSFNILEIFDHAINHNPEVWSIMTEKGDIHAQARNIHEHKIRRETIGIKGPTMH